MEPSAMVCMPSRMTRAAPQCCLQEASGAHAGDSRVAHRLEDQKCIVFESLDRRGFPATEVVGHMADRI